MKVLWMLPRPLKFKDSNYVGSNWVSSMEEQFVKNDIDFRIAFGSNNNSYIRHKINNKVYYEIPKFKNNSPLSTFYRRIFNKIENEALVVKYLKNVIDDYKPDIIHIWGSENVLGVITKHSQVPHIIHFQGNLNVYYHKLFIAFNKDQVYRLATLWERISRSGKIFFNNRFNKERLREQEIYAYCKNVFGRTIWDKKVSRILAPNAKYFHCDEILRTEFYEKTWQTPNNTKFTIVTIIRDNIYKGLETIYQTSNLLNKVNFEFEWRIIGIKDSEISARLIRKYSDFEIDNLPITLLGKQNSPFIIKELLSSDLMVHPSHIDNSPNSVCEGMIMGMPVLATFVGGMPTIIENNKNGYLIQDGDPWSMAGSIIEIKDKYQQAIEIGKNAKETAKKRHNRELIFKTVINTYEQIINDNNESHSINIR